MSFHAKIYARGSGRFLLAMRVGARSLREAEEVAKCRASFFLRGDPRDLDVRRLHQVADHKEAAR